jgi:hypothetical protein
MGIKRIEDAGTVVKWEQEYRSRAVEVQRRQRGPAIDSIQEKCGLSWSCRVVWLKRATAPQAGSFKTS